MLRVQLDRYVKYYDATFYFESPNPHQICLRWFRLSLMCHFPCLLFLLFQFPEESVYMQQRIINRVESDPHYKTYLQAFDPAHDGTAAAAIILAAKQIARTVNAKLIVTFTVGGSTAMRASKKRPDVPIMAVSPLKETARQLVLSWGVYPEFSDADKIDTDDFRSMLRDACSMAIKKGLVDDEGDLLVVTAGFPFGTPGAANIVRVVPAAGPSVWDSSL